MTEANRMADNQVKNPANTADNSPARAGADTEARKGGRSGGRSGNRRSKAGGAITQLAWKPPVNPDRPVEPIDEGAVLRIHDAAMRILEETGIHFMNDEAVRILKAAGCKTDGQCVYMDRDFLMELVAKAPAQFTITPRDASRAITIGGNHIVFGNVSSPPNFSTMESGKQPGTQAAFRDLMKLTQAFNCIHFAGGYPVEPIDIHASVRHLDCLFDKITLSDKVIHAYALGTERIEDGMDMVRIGSGLTEEEFQSRPHMYTNINSVSPLKHDWPMLDGAMRLARRGQPVVISPFTLAGAMAPVTLAGAVALSVAECLCVVALLQIIRPGAPVVMGTFTSNVDMKSGAPAFGTPEYIRATQMHGQMARYYKLPMRASNACASVVPDAQATWESAFSLWACLSSGTHMVYHGAGWLEGGLIASYEKFVIDCEMIQHLSHYMEPVPVDDDTLAFDAIAEIGPFGHYFGGEHTQARYETAFYSPFLSDWRNYEAYELGGSVDTTARANRIWKQMIADFEAPALDVAIRDELADFVTRRKAEGGAPTDF